MDVTVTHRACNALLTRDHTKMRWFFRVYLGQAAVAVGHTHITQFNKLSKSHSLCNEVCRIFKKDEKAFCDYC